MTILKRAVALVVVVCSALAFVLILVHATVGDVGGSDIAPPHVAQYVATTSLPTRLRIPSLSINAHVQYVGITRAGTMGVPSNFTDVAWYDKGTVPGNPGTAAIDGHVDNGLALAGVFKHLGDIAVGDSIYIETQGGATLHFVVYDREVYPYKEVPLRDVFAQTKTPHLALITCQGAWVSGDKTYDQRLVVYAALGNS